MNTRWMSWFSEETTSDADAVVASIARARECVDATEKPWFSRYIAWLADEAGKPFPIAEHKDMIVAGVRSNTLKEMRAHLLDEIEKAKRCLAAAKENQDA